MTDNELQDNAENLITRRYRFVVDIEVSAHDVPKAIIESGEILDQYSTWEEKDFFDFVRLQQRMLYAVVRNSKVAEDILVDRAGVEAAQQMESEWALRKADEIGVEEIASPVFSELLSEDQQFVKEMIEQNSFIDQFEMALYDSFSAKVLTSSVVKIS